MESGKNVHVCVSVCSGKVTHNKLITVSIVSSVSLSPDLQYGKNSITIIDVDIAIAES